MATVHKSSEAQKRASKKYADAHKEEIKSKMKLYYTANAERIKQKRMARYYATKRQKELDKIEQILSKDTDVQ